MPIQDLAIIKYYTAVTVCTHQWIPLVCFPFHSFSKLIINIFALSVETPKEERPELQKKTYKWNTKEEAKQAFKELLKEKVSRSVNWW